MSRALAGAMGTEPDWSGKLGRGSEGGATAKGEQRGGVAVTGEVPGVLGRVFFFKVSTITVYFYAKEKVPWQGTNLPFEGEGVL